MKTATIAALLLVFALPTSRPAQAQRFTQTNLVSDLSGRALHIDPNLVNPWGLAPGGNGVFWSANNVTGTSTLYDPDGTIRPLVVTIPGGSPTGIVATASSDSAFDVPNGATTARAAFIFVSQTGIISAWSPAVNQTNAIQVEEDTAAVYTGAALGGTRINPLLYVADFKGGEIEAYDTSFAEVKLAGSFTDPNLPAGYYPFNIANVGGQLYVAYALQSSPGEEQPGGGLGIVSVFDMQGNFVRRFATSGELNAPWAIVQAPAGFGPFGGDILVGNFGDGRVLVYDQAGVYQAALQSGPGQQITNPGLWGLSFGRPAGSPAAGRLYFAAGIADETHGLFGYIALADSDTTVTPPVACDDNRSRDQHFWQRLCINPLGGHDFIGNPPGSGKDLGKGGDDGDDDDGDHDGDDGDDDDGDHPNKPPIDLDGLFACIGNRPTPNAFGPGGCFTAGCDLLRPEHHRTELERAALVLLVTRLNLCSGDVCDSLPIRCDERPHAQPLTLGAVADSLDGLLCSNGDREGIRRLVDALKCVIDGDDGENGDNDDDDQGENENDSRANQHRIDVKTIGVSPARLGDGPVQFAVNTTGPSMVQLRIYDVRGRLVAEPMSNSMVVGSATVNWNGTDSQGRAVPSGTYFYRAITADEAATGRLLIVR